jgi:uncharacterized membrane protein YhaH (DUF805 family)
MDWGNLFFKFGGRVNRAKYWLAWLVFIAIYAVLAVGGYLTDSMAFAAVNAMITIVIFICSIAVGIKRLHDRNKTGWYMVLFYVLPGVLFIAGVMIGMTQDGSTMVATALWLIAFAISIWAFVELGCLRGTIGINPYGPDPLAPEVLTPPVRTHA